MDEHQETPRRVWRIFTMPVVLALLAALIGSGALIGCGWPAPGTNAPTAPPVVAEVPVGSFVLELVEVPAGPFLMGSGDSDTQAFRDEKPQHTVTLETYWIGKTEVTNAQFRPFVEGDGYTNRAYWTEAGWQWREANTIDKPAFWNDPRWNGDQQPVVGISWFEAVAYCRWLEAQTGIPFRLPTEAEWEKAARGTDGRIYPWGDTRTAAQSNSGQTVGKTTPVGQYPAGASPYGALDMAGNVWEWCATKWGKTYPYQKEDEWAEVYLEEALRVIRGGSWYTEQQFVRAASRLTFGYPRDRDDMVGLRVASNTGRLAYAYRDMRRGQ